MKAGDLGPFWLRDRARTLRYAARDAERAYQGQLAEMCEKVARAYREAADLLEDRANKLEAAAKELRDAAQGVIDAVGASDRAGARSRFDRALKASHAAHGDDLDAFARELTDPGFWPTEEA